MLIKRTKKFLIDCASLRLDSRIKFINEERKSRLSTEYYWYEGQNKNIKKKYKKITNKEISPSNPPLISLIRRGMVTSKNPFLYTSNSIEDVLDNCKFDEYGTKFGLDSNEEAEYIERNIMFKSYDEICFGDSTEQSILESFLETSIILDILSETHDENLWRIILGYMPLNIKFEKIKLDVVDLQKVYNILLEEHYELLITGIFRATRLDLNLSYWFWEYYKDKKEKLTKINKLIYIDDIMTAFYHDVIKKEVDHFFKERSYYGYKGKYIQDNCTYQNLEPIISIQQEMHLYQRELSSEEIQEKYGNEIWDNDLICSITKDNFDDKLGKYTDEYLGYEEIEEIYATHILDLSEKLLNSLCSFQIFQENTSHWQGNYLGYVKKYQYGNEVLNYLKTGDKEILRPLINKSLRWKNTVSARERHYKKKHPNSWAAREERKLWEKIEQIRAKNKKED